MDDTLNRVNKEGAEMLTHTNSETATIKIPDPRKPHKGNEETTIMPDKGEKR
jgi:hypothetical protein